MKIIVKLFWKPSRWKKKKGFNCLSTIEISVSFLSRVASCWKKKKKKTLDKYLKNGQNSDANYAQLKYLEGYYQKKKKKVLRGLLIVETYTLILFQWLPNLQTLKVSFSFLFFSSFLHDHISCQ